VWSKGGIKLTRKNGSNQRKTYSIVTSAATDSTQRDLESNTGKSMARG